MFGFPPCLSWLERSLFLGDGVCGHKFSTYVRKYQSVIPGLPGKSMFSFVRNCQMVF